MFYEVIKVIKEDRYSGAYIPKHLKRKYGGYLSSVGWFAALIKGEDRATLSVLESILGTGEDDLDARKAWNELSKWEDVRVVSFIFGKSEEDVVNKLKLYMEQA